MPSRSTMYILGSTMATSAMVANVYHKHEQFYPTMVQITRSNLCLAILGNMGLICCYLIFDFFRRIYFGRLRQSEQDQIKERLKFSLMDTFLIMTIFRNEFSMKFIAFFTLLLVVKVFHWLAALRIEMYEQTPNLPWSFHLRLQNLLVMLALIDGGVAYYSVTTILASRPSVLLLFAFEAGILGVMVLQTVGKYIIQGIATRFITGNWPNKGLYTFYLELTADFLRLVGYLAFFFVVFKYYGLPLHIIRELYQAFRSFRNRMAEFLRYRRLTYNLEGRYPSATAEEIRGMQDNICLVCREEMQPPPTTPEFAVKRLPCGHHFHFHCLRSWLERASQCPYCRYDLLSRNPPVNARAPAAAGAAGANGAAPAAGAAPVAGVAPAAAVPGAPVVDPQAVAAAVAAGQLPPGFFPLAGPPPGMAGMPGMPTPVVVPPTPPLGNVTPAPPLTPMGAAPSGAVAPPNTPMTGLPPGFMPMGGMNGMNPYGWAGMNPMMTPMAGPAFPSPFGSPFMPSTPVAGMGGASPFMGGHSHLGLLAPPSTPMAPSPFVAMGADDAASALATLHHQQLAAVAAQLEQMQNMHKQLASMTATLQQQHESLVRALQSPSLRGRSHPPHLDVTTTSTLQDDSVSSTPADSPTPLRVAPRALHVAVPPAPSSTPTADPLLQTPTSAREAAERRALLAERRKKDSPTMTATSTSPHQD